VALGAGNVGNGLARRHAARGHDVCLAFSRNRGKLKAGARAVGARPAEPQEAVAAAEAVVLATPWTVTEAALQSPGDLSRKLLWDCTNPLKPEMSGLVIGTETCGGELVAAWAGSGARVVKAIPPFAEQMAREGPLILEDGRSPSVFVCGDDSPARSTVITLVRDIGAEPIEAGVAAQRPVHRTRRDAAGAPRLSARHGYVDRPFLLRG
jgi:8-hydroxy-5-deazaflavin:NADPH oxidoreductase